MNTSDSEISTDWFKLAQEEVWLGELTVRT